MLPPSLGRAVWLIEVKDHRFDDVGGSPAEEGLPVVRTLAVCACLFNVRIQHHMTMPSQKLEKRGEGMGDPVKARRSCGVWVLWWRSW